MARNMGKLGRKICCNYDPNVKCLLLVKGQKQCVFEETTEKQQEEGVQQLGVCALLPESERENILAQIKNEKVSNFRSWKN